METVSLQTNIGMSSCSNEKILAGLLQFLKVPAWHLGLSQ